MLTIDGKSYIPDDKLNQYDKNARHEASLNYNCGL